MVMAMRKRRLNLLIVSFAVLLIPEILFAQDCERKDTFQKIVRIDEGGKKIPHLFLVEESKTVDSMRRPAEAMRHVKALREWVRQCKPHWKERWTASFFADAKFAAYKTEQSFQDHPGWAKAYLAEYDEGTQTLKLYPLSPSKVVTVSVGKEP